MIKYIIYLLVIAKVLHLCIRKNPNLFNKIIVFLIIVFYPYCCFYLIFDFNILALITDILLFYLYANIFMNIDKYLSHKHIDNLNLKYIHNGRNLNICCILSTLLQLGILTCILVGAIVLDKISIVFIYYFLVLSYVSLFVTYIMFVSSAFRMIMHTKRIIKPLYLPIFISIFVPILNLFPAIYLIYITSEEFEYEMYINQENVKIENKYCKTKYPILFLHGIVWRDHEKSNYWGRIPNELIKNGAKVYYGYHDSTTSIEVAAEQIKNKINEIMKETGCEKVNIIAHSKAGLDSRYLISELKMKKHVASLTTISSPHRGSTFSDFLYNLPKPIFNTICLIVNFYSTLIDCNNPDFKTGVYQTTSKYCEEFNKRIKDSKEVYYQSVYSKLNNPFSDAVVFAPGCLISFLKSPENDGLVECSSSKYWENSYEIKRKGFRGISHADIIDFRRYNINDFDITKEYKEIVHNLKELGY